MGENRYALPEAANEQRLEIEMTTPGDDGEPVFLTGNFNNWQVMDEAYRMDKIGEGHYRFSFSTSNLPHTLEYKYIRGNWEGEELDVYGNAVPNRSVSSRASSVHDRVPRWKYKGLFYRQEFLPKLLVIHENFEIPQLIKTRRITALLPYNYESEPNRRYPVVYLQDGQNLFDDYAPFGNWALDKKLAVMAERGQGDLIVIAIDHAAEERLREFTPTTQTRLGIGDGKKYVRFLADTLKPYVDKNFRTLSDRCHTGIGGSSMGGLISIYAGLMYPEVYSKLLIFSPSLWVAPNIHSHAVNFEEPIDTKIYIYGGGDEGANMISNINRFKHAIDENGHMGKTLFKISIDPKGKHNEQRWGEEFPRAVEWLFFENSPQA